MELPALVPIRMGIVGKVKRLDARPFVSASPSRAVPSRVGVTQLREFRIDESKHQQPIRK